MDRLLQPICLQGRQEICEVEWLKAARRLQYFKGNTLKPMWSSNIMSVWHLSTPYKVSLQKIKWFFSTLAFRKKKDGLSLLYHIFSHLQGKYSTDESMGSQGLPAQNLRFGLGSYWHWLHVAGPGWSWDFSPTFGEKVMGKSLKKDRKFPEKKQGLEKNRWHYLFEDDCYLIIFDLGFDWFMMVSTCTQCVNSKISNNPTGEAKSQPIRSQLGPWGTQSRSFCGTRVVHRTMKHRGLSLTSGALAHGP